MRSKGNAGRVAIKTDGGLRMMVGNEKKRNVGAIVWLEDLERLGLTYYDLLEHVESLCVKAVVSPVHDSDTYTAADVRNWVNRHLDSYTGDVAPDYVDRVPKIGDRKKAHVHLGFKLTRQVTAHEASADLLGGLLDYPETKWAVIPDFDSYICYMVHMYNAEKYHYSIYDVAGFGGIDLSALSADDKMANVRTLCEIVDYAHEHKFRYVHQVHNWAASTGDYNLMKIVDAKGQYINMLLRSERQQRIDEAEARRRDKERNA